MAVTTALTGTDPRTSEAGVSEMRPRGEEPRDFEIVANGVRLHFVEWVGEGAPILLIHATGFHARIWDEVARRLPGRRVLSIDTRGHGLSDKPEPPYVWDYIGQDITDALRVLDLHDVVMVGHSMGGHSAVYATVREPSR
ncbi:MAG: alpha/beta fold hydrolase, partial [Dehalococcoidia bacterium]